MFRESHANAAAGVLPGIAPCAEEGAGHMFRAGVKAIAGQILTFAVAFCVTCAYALSLIAGGLAVNMAAPAKAHAMGTTCWQGGAPITTTCHGSAEDACITWDGTIGPGVKIVSYFRQGNYLEAVCQGVVYGAGLNPSFPYYTATMVLICGAGETSLSSGWCTGKPADGAGGPSTCGKSAADPVLFSSGDLIEREEDYRTGGLGQLFARSYSSQNGFLKNSFGANWASIIDRAAQVDIGSTVTAVVTLEGGEYYKFQGPSNAIAPVTPGLGALFTQISSSEWTFTSSTGEVSHFVAIPTGTRLDWVRLASGQTLYLAYGLNGRVSKIKDQDGNVLDVLWDGDVVSRITAPGGVTIQYNYQAVSGSASKRLIEVVKSVSGVSGSVTREYKYEDTRYPFALTGIEDERGIRTATWVYDGDLRVTQAGAPSGDDQYTFAYNDTTNERTITNPLGKQEVVKFSTVNGQMLITERDGQASTHCPSSTHLTSYSSNYSSSTTDEEGRVTAYTNNARGFPTQIVEAQGTAQARTTNITWHSAMDAPTEIVQPGLTTTYTVAPGTGSGTSNIFSNGPSSPHSYWRLRMLSNTGGAVASPNINLAEVEFRATMGGADQASGGSTIESGDGGSGVANAFDNNSSTYWSAPTTVLDSWVGYQFTSAVSVEQVAITSTGTYQPRDFVVEWSDNGTTWTPEWYALDASWGTSAETKTFGRLVSPSVTAAYPAWRVRIWGSNDVYWPEAGGYYGGLSELEFRATVGGADQASGGAPISNRDYAGYPASNAFDNDGATRWGTDQPVRTSAIGYVFSAPTAVAQISVKGSPNSTESPKDFSIQYYDGERWYVARDIRGATLWGSGENRTYSVVAPPESNGPSSPHSYWRLRMLSNTGGAVASPNINLAEVEFRATMGGADQASGGSTIESGDGGSGVANAFDNNSSTYWSAPTTVLDSWVGYQFTSAVSVEQVAITSTGTYQPRDFVVEWSDNGTTWTPEWYALDASWGTSAETKTFGRLVSPSVTAAYPAWRVRIWGSNTSSYANAGGEYASVAEIEFRGTTGGADQTSGGAAISNGDYAGWAASSLAFDNDNGTRWGPPQPPRTGAIGYYFSSPVSVGEVLIRSSSLTEESPKNFSIQFGDGERWYVARDIRGSTGWSNGEARTFSVP
jgi:hypothetical protein